MSRLRRDILHRVARRALVASLCTALLYGSAIAQSRRKQRTPRAIALVEWPAKGNPVVVPIAILIDGHFYDASIYMADPVPMALETGTVYEVEQSGDPVGFATLEGGINSNGTWIGAAKYLTKSAATAPLKRNTSTSVRPDPEEGPPRLHKGGAKTDKPDEKSPDKPADKSADKTPPVPTEAKPESTTTASDEERPRLRKPKEDQATPTPAPNANPPAQPASATTAAAPPANSDSDADYSGRPRLRRGKPVAVNAESAPAPAAARTTTTSTAVRGRQAQNPGPVRVMAAVSDSGGPESRPFLAPGSEQASPKMRSGMEDLATAALQKYATGHGGATVGPLEKVEVRAFDLSLTNQSTVVLMASAHVAAQPAPRRASQRQPAVPPAAPVDTDLTFWVTVIARENYNGDLRQLQAWSTDSKHLDAYPRMELIDALDADGDGRGELLFRAVSDLGRSFVIERVTADQVVALYDSGEMER